MITGSTPTGGRLEGFWLRSAAAAEVILYDKKEETEKEKYVEGEEEKEREIPRNEYPIVFKEKETKTGTSPAINFTLGCYYKIVTGAVTGCILGDFE
jgi:hypothetical protein